ncbi:unnamed protein product [Dovyalis caffra]|uniref:Uncharacterized protein n=1 Tax=Dovyalis caffra TaxID=77055 RepID=A0AAV1S3A2_9ROSI|nr:unnamed protein product [Dovyalis caffra]
MSRSTPILASINWALGFLAVNQGLECGVYNHIIHGGYVTISEKKVAPIGLVGLSTLTKKTKNECCFTLQHWKQGLPHQIPLMKHNWHKATFIYISSSIQDRNMVGPELANNTKDLKWAVQSESKLLRDKVMD